MEMSTASNVTAGAHDSMTVIYIMLSTIGMVGNAFVCLVMLQYHTVLNSTTNKLILHQSVVDLLGSLVFLLRRLLVLTPPTAVPDDLYGSLYCRLWWSEWPQYGMFLTSTYNMVAITTERYLAMCQPVRYQYMFSNHRVKLIVIGVWSIGWTPTAHLVFISYQENEICHASWPNRTFQAVGGTILCIEEFIVPLAIIISAYTKIISELHKRSKARAGENNHDAGSMLSKANKNITKTLFLVAVFFCICWTPTEINYILYNLGVHDNFVNSVVYQATNAMVVMNLCINPIIYCFTYQRFQKQAMKIMCCGFWRRINQVDITEEI